MTGDHGEDAVIAAVLLDLSADDQDVARQAEAALGSLTWGRGVGAITQHRLQHFLWYELPLKWIGSLDDRLDIAESLARALDLLGLARYAAVCRSQDTRAILEAYDRDPGHGLAAFQRANAASGIHPPDLPELTWGVMMGPIEAALFISVAEFLELAVSSGELVPGTRGWRTRQQGLVRNRLGAPAEALGGEALLQAIQAERLLGWVDGGRSAIRRTVLSPLVDRLLDPAPFPSGATDASFSLRWLLEQLVEGVVLTQTGNLGQKFVQAAGPRFGWDVPRLPRTEDDVVGLHLVRQFAHRLGLSRRSGRRLVLTARGREALREPERLWRCAARGLIGTDPFVALAGEMCLAMLINVEVIPASVLRASVFVAAYEVGFRNSRTGDPPDDYAVRWAIGETLNLCGALGLLSVGSSWRDRSYGLNQVGNATALEALRARSERSVLNNSNLAHGVPCLRDPAWHPR